MNLQPYVGITGPVTKKEVNSIINEFKDAGYNMDSPHIPMLGYLASLKTLKGQPIDNLRYPKIDDLYSLLEQADGGVLTMIHYNSREMNTLAEQVGQLFERIYEDNLCKAIQLNIIWPDIKQLKQIKDKFPDMQIVFSASQKVTAGKTPEEISERIGLYGNTINYVLIDPSGGRGLEFDLNSSLALYQELKNKTPYLIGFAGGFTGSNVAERAQKLISETKGSDFCIDAEGGLRDKRSNAYGDDDLNMKKVREYLQSVSAVLR